MNDLLGIFIYFSNLAIPPNERLSIGLGTIIRNNKSLLIQECINKFINKYSGILLFAKEIVDKYEESDIQINFEILIKELKTNKIDNSFAIFLREYSILSSQIYFSNSLVLKSYNLIPNKTEIIQILDSNLDKKCFNSIISIC